jgi:hypothetical protein
VNNLRNSLYFNSKTKSSLKATFNNPIIESIVLESDIVLKNQSLLCSIYKLREKNLLETRKINLIKYKGAINRFVINDIHSKSTNPGFVRT